MESKIEKKVCEYARLKGWWVWKLTILGWAGIPDRMLLKHGKVFFIEFKAPGEKPRKLQHAMIGKLKMNGFDAYVIDDIEEGKKIVDSH